MARPRCGGIRDPEAARQAHRACSQSTMPRPFDWYTVIAIGIAAAVAAAVVVLAWLIGATAEPRSVSLQYNGVTTVAFRRSVVAFTKHHFDGINFVALTKH